jgi:hypothetical protein
VPVVMKYNYKHETKTELSLPVRRVILSSCFKCHNLKARTEFKEDNLSKLDKLVQKKSWEFIWFSVKVGGVWVFGIDTQANSFQC